MKNKIINISNSLSFLRLVLTIPVCWFLLNNNKIWFLILVIAALLTDYLDGYFARKRNEITEFGKVMDPVADKVIIGAIAVIMLIQGLIPLWFLLAVLSRDILILIGGLYVSKKIGYVVYSDIIGKYSVTILALMMLGIIYKIELFSIYGIYIALIALIVSFVNYLIRMIKLLKNSTGK